MIRNNGETIFFKPQFNAKLKFSGDYAIAGIGRVYGVVSKNGEVKYKFKASKIEREDTYYFIEQDNNWKIYDHNVEPVSGSFEDLKKIKGSVKKARYFNEGLCLAKQNGKWGFIGLSFDFTISPKFDEVKPEGFKSGFLLRTRRRQMGLYKKKTEVGLRSHNLMWPDRLLLWEPVQLQL